MSEKLTIGFLPLVDACLPILARELGFAEEEGLDLALTRDVTWATVLDRLLYGHTDAAHMLAPLAIATTAMLPPSQTPRERTINAPTQPTSPTPDLCLTSPARTAANE